MTNAMYLARLNQVNLMYDFKRRERKEMMKSRKKKAKNILFDAKRKLFAP